MRFRNRISRVICIAMLAAFCAALVQPAFAESRRKKKQQQNQYVLRDKRIGKKFQKIQEFLDAERPGEARKVLDSIKVDKIKPYPRALVHQAYAFIESSSDNYPEAARRFQLAISENALQPQRTLGIRFNLGQIYMMTDDWDKAIETLEAWFVDAQKPDSPVKVNAISYYMLALAYYQNDDKKKAIPPATKAVEFGDKPKETWLQLLLSLHMEQENYKKAEPLLARLITTYPKKVYWTQLAAVLMELEKDQQSLAIQQLAYTQGYLDKDRELTRLASMYMFHDMPWRAAKILGKELDSGRVDSDYDAWRLYSNALLSARENAAALSPLEKAAILAENGEGYLQLSQVHIQNENWDKARSALDSAFQKGDLRNPGHANLLLGIVAYQQKRWGVARNAFARATRTEKTRATAQAWMGFVDREEQAAAVLEAQQKARDEAKKAAELEAQPEAQEETQPGTETG